VGGIQPDFDRGSLRLKVDIRHHRIDLAIPIHIAQRDLNTRQIPHSQTAIGENALDFVLPEWSLSTILHKGLERDLVILS
jgi:hypothetical protein